MRIYLLSVLKLAAAEHPPFDWRFATAAMAATVNAYQDAAGDRFDLEPARDGVHALAERLDRFYPAIGDGSIDGATANNVIMRLARILVPLSYTRGPRFDHDPALAVPALPILSLAAELDGLDDTRLGFALAQLVRGRNRVVAALDDACRLVDGALA